MKKRLRRKLGKGEYAHPYALTRKQREGNARMRHAVLGIIKEIGEERFIELVEAASESHYPPIRVPRQPPYHPNDHPCA